jgi:hypothetical protein
LNNPTGCLVYNDLTKCSQCNDTYALVNGTCTRIPLNCTGRTWYDATNYVCAAVSDTCKDFNASNGKCISCISTEYRLIDGVCSKIVDNCKDREYLAANGTCIAVDDLCQTFQRLGGRCTACSFGYKLDSNNKCVKIVCQARFVPNDFGECVKVS